MFFLHGIIITKYNIDIKILKLLNLITLYIYRYIYREREGRIFLTIDALISV